MNENIVTITLLAAPTDDEYQMGCILSNIPVNKSFDYDTLAIGPNIAE